MRKPEKWVIQGLLRGNKLNKDSNGPSLLDLVIVLMDSSIKKRLYIT
jgi:hypothetical protein